MLQATTEKQESWEDELGSYVKGILVYFIYIAY